jgi:hypothetical protein
MSQASEAPDEPGQGGEGDDGPVPLPFMQRVLDNHFLLLFLGVVVPTVFYLIWGIMEVANIPLAQ